MSKSTATNTSTSHLKVAKTSKASSNAGKQQFVSAAVTMSWQLVLVVLVPIIGGVELDKALHTATVYVYCGLGVALIGSALVMWRAVQVANALPVPKLTPAQREVIKRQYEAEDDE